MLKKRHGDEFGEGTAWVGNFRVMFIGSRVESITADG